jgi:hypothetical protein
MGPLRRALERLSRHDARGALEALRGLPQEQASTAEALFLEGRARWARPLRQGCGGGLLQRVVQGDNGRAGGNGGRAPRTPTPHALPPRPCCRCGAHATWPAACTTAPPRCAHSNTHTAPARPNDTAILHITRRPRSPFLSPSAEAVDYAAAAASFQAARRADPHRVEVGGRTRPLLCHAMPRPALPCPALPCLPCPVRTPAAVARPAAPSHFTPPAAATAAAGRPCCELAGETCRQPPWSSGVTPCRYSPAAATLAALQTVRPLQHAMFFPRPRPRSHSLHCASTLAASCPFAPTAPATMAAHPLRHAGAPPLRAWSSTPLCCGTCAARQSWRTWRRRRSP